MNQKLFFANKVNVFWDFKHPCETVGIMQINSKNFPAAFFSVIGIMAEDCNYHISKCYAADRRLFFEGYYNQRSSELMIRYGQSELVVARIEFAHQRSGYMTKLFEVLKHIKRSYHLDRIVIECVMTDEMKAWCRKNKLTPCGNPDSIVSWEWK